MSEFELQFFSIVFIGNLNPQILSHDFLMHHHILPIDEEPFKSFIAQTEKSKFSEFISTPVLTSIKYDLISIFINENQFQARHDSPSNLVKSPIIKITKKYFEELCNTPLKVGGININGKIFFASEDEEEKFDQKLGINKSNLLKATEGKGVRTNFGFKYEWEDGVVEVNIPRLKGQKNQYHINFNYEYPCTELKSFLSQLDKIQFVYEHFIKIISNLDVKVKL